MNRRVDVIGAVENLINAQTGRQHFSLTLKNFSDLADRLHCVCVTRQQHAERHRRISVEFRNYIIALLPRLDARHIFHSDERTLAVRFKNDVAELFNRHEAPLDFTGILFFLPHRQRHRADRARRRLQILFFDRVDHVRNRQIELGKFIGVEPNAHRIIRTEYLNIAHAVDALYFVQKINVGVVLHKCAIISTIGRIDRNHVRHIIRRFASGHALRLNVRRQRRICDRHVVLHLDRVHIAVGADLKNHAQTVSTGIVGVRRHIIHALRSVDLLFNDLRNRLIDHVGIGAGVSGRNRNGRRRNLRVLSDRQLQCRQRPGDYYYKRYDDCKDRAVNEKFCHTRRLLNR